ncbi:MAG: dihydrofolate reductase family protein [Methylobacteriaceae bacterium]|nr:dihydrofolate reductase family protein [Methylobacteriaceae bacterium]
MNAVNFASGDQPSVIAQLGQTLDGRIATVTGESRWINGRCALDHLHRLRASVDAVVIGVGTLIADDPQLTVRRVAGAHPARVVIDPNGRAPADARCLRCPAAPTYLISAPGVRRGPGVIELPLRDGALAPADIVAALAAMGLKRLLIEGGARTVSGFVDAGMVDSLHLLVAPMIIGSGRQGLELRPEGRLAAALRPATTVTVFEDGDVLFECDLRRQTPARQGEP